jgi:hypothetical protein
MSEHEGGIGRRKLIGLGTAAAAGAAVALVAGADPVGATVGTMQFGTNNNSGADQTSLSTTTALTGFIVSNTGTGHGIYGQGGQTGVTGRSTSPGGVGVMAESTNGPVMFANTQTGGPAVRANIGATPMGPLNPNHSVEVTHQGTGTGVDVNHMGLGKGINVHLNDPTNVSDAVTVLTNGPGAGVVATTTAGTGIVATTTTGTGIDVSSETGRALSATTTDVANTSPAVQAQANGKGSAILAIASASAMNATVRATSNSAFPAINAVGKPVPANGTTVPLAGNAAALKVSGVLSHTRSGVAHITGTSLAVDVPGGLTASSHVLATMQTTTAANVTVKSATPSTSTGKVTITLSAAAPAGGVDVGWFVFG